MVDLRADGESADETDYATCATKDEAKLALFDVFWAVTQDDEWLWSTD